MVYTDNIHLVANTLEELHRFAGNIGLKKHWFEGVRKGHPHYDLFGNKRELAIYNGAMKVSSKEIVRMFQNKQLQVK